MKKQSTEVHKAAQLLGKQGGKATLKKWGREQLREWGKLGAKDGKKGGRPQLPKGQVSKAALYQRRRRAQLRKKQETGGEQ